MVDRLVGNNQGSVAGLQGRSEDQRLTAAEQTKLQKLLGEIGSELEVFKARFAPDKRNPGNQEFAHLRIGLREISELVADNRIVPGDLKQNAQRLLSEASAQDIAPVGGTVSIGKKVADLAKVTVGGLGAKLMQVYVEEGNAIFGSSLSREDYKKLGRSLDVLEAASIKTSDGDGHLSVVNNAIAAMKPKFEKNELGDVDRILYWRLNNISADYRRLVEARD